VPDDSGDGRGVLALRACEQVVSGAGPGCGYHTAQQERVLAVLRSGENLDRRLSAAAGR
jgi:hypothetical protein